MANNRHPLLKRLLIWLADRWFPRCGWQRRVEAGDFAALRAGTPPAWPYRLLPCDCARRIPDYLSPDPVYQAFLARHSFLSCTQRRALQRRIKHWAVRPLISILLPVYRPDPAHLRECLRAVEEQLYPDWELCAVEDGGGVPKVRALLEDFAGRHRGKVKLRLRDGNRGITATSQEALGLAAGEFVALLDHDDRLLPETLYQAVSYLQQHPDTDWLYGDNDKLDPHGERCCYHPKPDWSPELLLTYNYVLHPSIIRRALVERVGGFRPGYEGSQDHDLYLRLAEAAGRVAHLPRVLYSWRQSAESVSANPQAKDYAYQAALRALDDALRRRGEAGKAIHAPHSWLGSYRILRPVPPAKVDLVLWREQDLAFWETQAPPARIGNVFLIPGEPPGVLLDYALNHAQAAYLLVCRPLAALKDSHLLNTLLANLAPAGVAAAGGKALGPDGRVDHCGLGLAETGEVFFPLRGWPADEAGHGAHGALPRNVAALSPFVALFKTDALRQAGGFDSAFASADAAVLDACLKLRSAGWRLVADGGIRVTLAETYRAPPGLEPGGKDFQRFLTRHEALIGQGDPYYPPLLRRAPADFALWRDISG